LRREWQQCRKEKNEEEFSSTENIRATSDNTERHRYVTNEGKFLNCKIKISLRPFLAYSPRIKNVRIVRFFFVKDEFIMASGKIPQ